MEIRLLILVLCLLLPLHLCSLFLCVIGSCLVPVPRPKAPGAACQNPTGCARVLLALVQGLLSAYSPFTLKRERDYTSTVSLTCQLNRT